MAEFGFSWSELDGLTLGEWNCLAEVMADRQRERAAQRRR